ncbi:hypothetical protein EON81_08350 [bacterium]|nr:MAG: hypothetical protein EON81_08350 [bacterium]
MLEVLATDGDKELGGKDIDEALMRFAVAKAGLGFPGPGTRSWDALKKEAEKAKRSLSSQTVSDLMVPAFAMVGGDLADLEVEVTREEFERLIEPFVARSLEKIRGCLAKSGLERARVQRLLLVGGTCYIPRVREAVETFFALKAESGVDPDLAVSQGAAISAGLKTGAINPRTSVLVQDAATFRMGTSAIEDVGDREMLMFSELMPANAAIPFVRTRRYVLRSPEQEEVEFEVFQDPSGRATFPDDAIRTGAIGLIRDIPPSTDGQPREVEVEFRYDENHIVRVAARVIGVDRETVVQLNADQTHPGPLSGLMALPEPSVVDAVWEKSPLASRNAALIKRAETVLESKPDNGERIEVVLLDLKSAVATNDPDRANDARERLTDLLADV